MTAEDAVPILARWIADLRRDLRLANHRIKKLELNLGVREHQPLNDLYSFWLDHHTANEIADLARELDNS